MFKFVCCVLLINQPAHYLQILMWVSRLIRKVLKGKNNMLHKAAQ